MDRISNGSETEERTRLPVNDQTGENIVDYSKTQKEIADRTREILLDNLERHVTIAELARTLHVSQTQIKDSFHRVFGMPVFAYTRRQRMKEAARQLELTEDSVLEIAGKYGYENGSKFASAFRSVIGTSPSGYRKRIRWEQENRRAGSRIAGE